MSSAFELCVLSSGSRANATLISYNQTNLLIDCGLTAKGLNTRLREIGRNPEEITDIVITHEHCDHVLGVCKVARKTGARIWVTEKTARAWKEFHTHPPARRSFFTTGASFRIGELEVDPFAISHDAVDPVGLRISSSDCSIGYCTDLGHVTVEVREKLRGLTALILESNHEPALLAAAPYPAALKARISSRHGHLSNQAAAALLEELVMEEKCKLEVVIAGHISEKANDPLIVRDTLKIAIAKHSKQDIGLITANAINPTSLWNSKSIEVTSSLRSVTKTAEQLLELF
jgi:phosphoribosyl 1,2-cyclic phosphodiesterase